MKKLGKSMKTLSQGLGGLKQYGPKSKPLGSSKSKTKWQNSSFDFLQLISNWSDIAGDSLSKNTIPLKFHGQTMTILTNHSAFAQQLTLLEQVLIKKVTNYYPQLCAKLKKLNFQVNARYFEQKEKVHVRPKVNQVKTHPQSPEFKQWKKEASELFNDVEDEESKKLLSSIYFQLKESQKQDS